MYADKRTGNKITENRYNALYKKEKYDRIGLIIPKDKEIPYRLNILSQSIGKSKNQIILEAIEAYLEKEGL